MVSRGRKRDEERWSGKEWRNEMKSIKTAGRRGTRAIPLRECLEEVCILPSTGLLFKFYPVHLSAYTVHRLKKSMISGVAFRYVPSGLSSFGPVLGQSCPNPPMR